LVAADFSAATGSRLLDIPYKGVAPVVQALLSGEIDAAFVPVAANTLELIRTGKLKVIGVANTKRNPHLPSVPTLSEGKTLKNFMYGAWAGVFIPTSVPEPIAARLSKEIAEVVKTDEFQRFLVDSAALPVEPLTLSQAAAVYKTEMEKYGRIAKAIKLEPQ
jgi:tripartite-type tricarboxylate transporter receptor subunit TctC